MTILTSLPYYFLLSAFLISALATQISRRVSADLTILSVIGLLFFCGFFAAVFFDLLYYLLKKRPVDVWKLGWLGVLGLFGIGFYPMFCFYTFFVFFGFKQINHK